MAIPPAAQAQGVTPGGPDAEQQEACIPWASRAKITGVCSTRRQSSRPLEGAYMDAAREPVTFRQLFRNYLSLAGGLIAGIGFGTNIFLILTDLLTPSHNPYVGIVTYMLLPGITMVGLGLTAVGAVVRYVRLRHGREFLVLPQIDLNTPRHRLILGGSLMALFLFLGLSAVGGYQAYHFTDSVQFCGQACHTVMKPEFTAYPATSDRGPSGLSAPSFPARTRSTPSCSTSTPARSPRRSATCGRPSRPASSATGRPSSGVSSWRRGRTTPPTSRTRAAR